MLKRRSTGKPGCWAFRESRPTCGRCSPPRVQVKAAGGVRTLDALLAVMDLGVTRVGATATSTILDDFRARASGAQPVGAASVDGDQAY